MIVPVDVGVGEKLTTPDADQDSCNIIISWRVDVMDRVNRVNRVNRGSSPGGVC